MSTPTDSEIPPGHGLFPIRHVCSETGVHPVTLRAWERRYGLIRPLRTPKGHRLYSGRDIDRIRRIVALLDEGVAVSQVGRLLQTQPPGKTPHGYGPEAEGVAPADAADSARVPGGVMPHVIDPLSETLLEATRSLSPVQIERTYARLVMRHGWDAVHDPAFLTACSTLRERARRDPDAEARFGVFSCWATASFAEQLRSALLLCEGPPCPAVLYGTGHRRLEGTLFLLASVRKGLRVLPLPDVLSRGALNRLASDLHSPAIVMYLAAPPVSGLEAERVRAVLDDPQVHVYVAGPGCGAFAAQAGRAVSTLPGAPLEAADLLTRQLLGSPRT